LFRLLHDSSRKKGVKKGKPILESVPRFSIVCLDIAVREIDGGIRLKSCSQTQIEDVLKEYNLCLDRPPEIHEMDHRDVVDTKTPTTSSKKRKRGR
jgi:hypothetical protein